MRLFPRGSWVCLVVFILAALRLGAMSVIPPTFDELVQKAEVVVRGEVVAVEGFIKGEGAQRRPMTRVTFRVERAVVGTAPETISLDFFGGQMDDKIVRIEGMPDFKVGDRDILFVEGNGRYFCPLVAVNHGRYRIEHSDTAASEVVLRADGEPLSSVVQVSQALRTEGTVDPQRPKIVRSAPMTVLDFERQIEARAAVVRK